MEEGLTTVLNGCRGVIDHLDPVLQILRSVRVLVLAVAPLARDTGSGDGRSSARIFLVEPFKVGSSRFVFDGGWGAG